MIQVIICGPSSTAFFLPLLFFFSFFFIHSVLSPPPPRIVLLPGTRHRLSSTTTTSLPPIPLSRGVRLFYEIVSAHTFSRHFLLSSPGRITSADSIFSNGWMSSPLARNHRPVLPDKEQQTTVVAIRAYYFLSNRPIVELKEENWMVGMTLLGRRRIRCG